MSYTTSGLPERLIITLALTAALGVVLALARGAAAPIDPVVRAQQLVNSAVPDRLALPLFSPDDDIKQVLLGFIRATRGRIYVAVYMFTDLDIADALIEKHRSGVPVELVVDHNCALTEWSKVPKIRRAGVPVYVFPQKAQPSRRDLLMHNKFLVCLNVLGRRAITVTGSFNFTRSANAANHENMLILDSYAVAQRYIQRFVQIKQQAKPFSVAMRPTHPKPKPARKDIKVIIDALCRYIETGTGLPDMAPIA